MGILTLETRSRRRETVARTFGPFQSAIRTDSSHERSRIRAGFQVLLAATVDIAIARRYSRTDLQKG